MTTVTNTVSKFEKSGIEEIIFYKRNVNSDNARKKGDGRAEARILELATSPTPDGRVRWTLRLL